MGRFFKGLAKVFGGFVALVVIAVGVIWMLPTHTQDVTIDFTRHLSDHVQSEDVAMAEPETFFGVAGSARMIVTGMGEGASATITLNGDVVASPDNFTAGAFEVPVELVADDNIMIIALDGAPDTGVNVRIKQVQHLQMHVMSRIHFNTNVSNFPESHEFYKSLGFQTASDFPKANTVAMARSMGIYELTKYDGSKGGEPGGYLLDGRIMNLGGFGNGNIDLIFYEIPAREGAPYAKLNHLGMARATMPTTDIQADYKYLTGIGVNFLAPPMQRADGKMFATFTDLDGTFYELLEVEDTDEDSDNGVSNITGVAQVLINVSDYERSRAWYQMMGYEEDHKLPSSESAAVAQAMGFDGPIEIDGGWMTGTNDKSTLEIVQWITPYDGAAPYPVPINHLGIARMAFATADIEADVATLKAQGVKFVSPITPCCSGNDSSSSIVAFYDPDGTIMELAGFPGMDKLFPILQFFAD